MPSSPPPADRSSRFALLFAGGFVFLSVVARGVAAFTRYFNHDEFQVWWTAWARASGLRPGRDFYLYSYHLLSELLVPLFRATGPGFAPLFISRFAIYLAGLAILALVYVLTRQAFRDRLAAVLAVLATTYFTAFAERVNDVRGDPFNALAALGAFALLHSGARTGRARAFVLTGLLLGLGLTSSPKTGLCWPFVLVVGALGLQAAGVPRLRALARLALVPACAAAVFALFLAYVQWHERDPLVGETQRHFLDLAVNRIHSTADQLKEAWDRDAVFFLAAAAGALVWRVRSRGAARAERAFPILIALNAVLYTAINTQFYQYNFVYVTPALAPLAGFGLASAVRALAARWPAVGRPGAALAIALYLVPLVPRQLLVPRETNAFQRRLVEYLLQATRPGDRVFALEGVGLFRPSTFHWRLSLAQGASYRAGNDLHLPEEFARTPPLFLVRTYRFNVLTAADQEFLSRHYVPINPLLAVPGARLAGAADFDLLVGGRYLVASRDAGSTLAIDGVAAGPSVDLAPGPHHASGPGIITLLTPERAAAGDLEVERGDQALHPFGWPALRGFGWPALLDGASPR